MKQIAFESDETFARQLDERDPLGSFRDLFFLPQMKDSTDCIYLTGNSLGLQPKKVKENIAEELEDWARLGVEGHFHAKHPWLPYHENLTQAMARIVGAKPIEVVVMNTLTVNLHLMMVSFYRPTPERYKIIMERGAFPSDQYAITSQVRFHGFNPKDAIIELQPREGEDFLRDEDILETIRVRGLETALILIGSPNYLTGQAFNLSSITSAGHEQGCCVGFDLAHGAGNLRLNLHDSGPDFAVWCSYKYLNGGPGNLAGCFVHERHAHSSLLPRFAGWWGQNKEKRFLMEPEFTPISGAEGWQLSNPPIFQLAALRASMDIFDHATMDKIVEKSQQLTGYLEFLLEGLPKDLCSLITPKTPGKRGAQLSLRFYGNGRALIKTWAKEGVICDFREPNIIRIAPTALYNRYIDVFKFVKFLETYAKTE